MLNCKSNDSYKQNSFGDPTIAFVKTILIFLHFTTVKITLDTGTWGWYNRGC